MSNGILILVAVLLMASVYGYGRYTGYSNEHKARLEEVAGLELKLETAKQYGEKISRDLSEELNRSEKQLKEYNSMLVTKDKELKKRIAQYEELKRISIPRDAIGVFNDSLASSQPREAPNKDQASLGTNEEARKAGTLPNGNFGTFLGVVVSNNLKHLSCINQVEQTQKFICALYKADGQPLEYEVCQEKQ